MLNKIDFTALDQIVRQFRDGLRENQEIINRLNVYPVPDGDTGTNMALTAESVVSEIEAIKDELSMSILAKAISHGSLMGARGNSGIIISQILRGISSVFELKDEIDCFDVATAFEQASLMARKAVLRPVEGTILTVATAAAEAGLSACKSDNADIKTILEAIFSGGVSALRMTPELLPVLAESGVVDAGGAGLIELFRAFIKVCLDYEPDNLQKILPDKVLEVVSKASAKSDIQVVNHGVESVGDLRYEVMFILEANDESIDAFKDVWGGIGDSIVVVGSDGLYNCHIHTGDIGAAIEAGIDTGRPRNIRVTDLAEQVEEEHWVRQAEDQVDETDLKPVHSGPPPVTAVVAVATGSGVKRIFHSLGVHSVVSGGQSMNPSTADLLKAVEELDSPAVVILPNNKNIIPVANEVDALTKKAVRVVPTKGIVEGFAALLAYDPEAGPGENLSEMTKSAEGVIAGEVTMAVRDASSSAGQIHEGDWLGISREGIQVVELDLAKCCIELLDKLVTEDHEIVTVIEGEGYSVNATRLLSQWLSENREGISVEVHQGGQPLYPYLFSIE